MNLVVAKIMFELIEQGFAPSITTILQQGDNIGSRHVLKVDSIKDEQHKFSISLQRGDTFNSSQNSLINVNVDDSLSLIETLDAIGFILAKSSASKEEYKDIDYNIAFSREDWRFFN